MRKKLIWKKMAAVFTAAAMTAATMAGCGAPQSADTSNAPTGLEQAQSPGAANQSGEGNSPGTVTYPADGSVTLTYGMTTATAWNDRYEKFTDLPLGKELIKQTGYNLDMVHVEDKTAMNLLIASGELPDIIGFNWQSNYNGGEEKAIKDGVIFGMSEEFVKENAPDYWKVLESNPELLKQVKTPSGDIFGFAFILGDDLLKGGYGMIVRDDWCKELGIELPETPEEFTGMLKAFKEQKGAEVPLSAAFSQLGDLMDRGIITSPFNLVTRDVYVDNGQVKIGYAQQEYKEVLAWLNQLYADGLLDPNFSTIDDQTVTANILTGKSGASSGACGSKLGTWLTTNKDMAGYSLAGTKNLVANRGDRAMYGHYNTDVVGGTTVITTMCRDREAAARFLNYGYTEEGHMLYNFGIEGQSYEMVDGKPAYTDLVLNNPDGLTVQKALSEYQLAYGNGPFVQDKDYLLQYYSLDAQKKALETWTDNDAKKYKLPRITISTDSISEYSSILSDIKTYRDEMTIKFIKGTEPLDNYETYMQTLKTMGIDRLQEIIQAAVDEYNSR